MIIIFLFSSRAFAKNVSEQAGKVIEVIVLTAEKQVAAARMVQMVTTDYGNLANKLKDVSKNSSLTFLFQQLPLLERGG